ncbi:unnamed protein product [Linum tenue]|uniref:Leucine-rich repeat-containing N-terminal plant-type domain-containing protein n=1 Tax=Linum tenue TaxID=586396 RepID=A0AAV0N4X6_9ROSI|nr:unnamed protein product [Linum tenue]
MISLLTTVLIVLLVSAIWMGGLWDGTLGAGCSADEREALLKFKADLEDPRNWLSSWVGQGDCCTWSRVVCDNHTGHVTQLHLGLPHNSVLSGKLNPSLLELKYLGYLDLSYNDFHGIPIPSFLGLMTSLNTLYLDGAGFGGLIPHQLGNLSKLQQLGIEAAADYVLYADSLSWLSGLSSLEFLDFSKVDLSNASDWLDMIITLPSLSELYLSHCQIPHIPPLANVNMSSSLSALSLYHNQFGQTFVPSWVFHLKNLTYLNLAYNTFAGPIPAQLQNLTSLRTLDLSFNYFNHSVPNWLYGLHHLEKLDLYSNKLDGRVSTEIGNLSSLIYLDMSVNYGLEFERGIPDSFKSFCQLRSLSLRYVKLNQNVSELLEILGVCASGTLQELSLSSCQLHGQLTDRIGMFKNLNLLKLQNNSISGPLPISFGEMKSLYHVDLSRNKINGRFPTSFGALAGLSYVDISQNAMHGVVLPEIHFANLTKLAYFFASGNHMVFKAKPDWVPSRLIQMLNLESWYVGPGFPHWLNGLQYLSSLDLSNTGISEPIPDWFWSMSSRFYYLNFSSNCLEGPLPTVSSNLTFLDLSNNLLSGNLVKFLCFNPAETRTTQYLNLQGNLFSGEIPDCWKNWQSLEALKLSSNKFTGRIPNSIGTLTSLLSLHIQNNSLTGDIPLSLGNCSKLLAVDLGYNELVGEIPRWVGKWLSKLSILNLRANKFHGSMPVELCHLQFVQILDLSHNSLSGSLPACLGNFSAMATSDNSDDIAVIYIFIGGGEVYRENQILSTKGRFVDYSTILNYVRSVDLSCNNFSGVIPGEITDLKGLHYLNLSHNLFSGRMPEALHKMESLESLDLSVNQLSGVVPPGLASLTFLCYLNLSYNNLSGKIPSSTQLQSFDSWSFIGNRYLCGPPLNNGCSVRKAVPGSGNGDEDDEFLWFSVITSLGFVAGFAVTVWSFFFGLSNNVLWIS